MHWERVSRADKTGSLDPAPTKSWIDSIMLIADKINVGQQTKPVISLIARQLVTNKSFAFFSLLQESILFPDKTLRKEVVARAAPWETRPLRGSE